MHLIVSLGVMGKTGIFPISVKITIGSFNALAMALPRSVAKCPLFKNNFASDSKICSPVRKCWYKSGCVIHSSNISFLSLAQTSSPLLQLSNPNESKCWRISSESDCFGITCPNAYAMARKKQFPLGKLTLYPYYSLLKCNPVKLNFFDLKTLNEAMLRCF